MYFFTSFFYARSYQKVTDKGYGFISPDNGSDDLFFHANDVVEGLEFNTLQEGDVVTFEMGESPKGPKAVEIALASESAGMGGGMGDDAGAGDDDDDDDDMAEAA